MGINAVSFSDTGPQMSKLAELVGAVKEGVGIKGAIQNQGIQANQHDPNSAYSKDRQAQAGAAYDYLANLKQITQPQADEMKANLAHESGADLDEAVTKSPLLQLTFHKMAADAQANRINLLAEPKNDANKMRANTAYDNVIGKNYEQRLDAANRVHEILKAIQNGSLVPTKSLGSQLANDINLLQAQHSTVSGIEHVTPNTLFGKGAELVHYISGDPQASITTQDMDQMSKENDLLYDELGKQHESKFKSWFKGNPASVQPALISRFKEARSQYFPDGPRSASSSSGDHPHDSAAVTWAKSNPEDPRSAKILKLNGGQ